MCKSKRETQEKLLLLQAYTTNVEMLGDAQEGHGLRHL